jgi:anti-sigma-K factor RskA
MTADPATLDRLYDLLADRATVGLSLAEADELSALLTRWPHVDPNEFDRAAAALQLAADPEPLAVPPDLMAKLEAAAAAHFARPAEPTRLRRSTAFYWAVCGWSCAATVMIGFVAVQLSRREPTVAEKRARLAADPNAVRYASDDRAKPNGPSGTIVFSKAKQEGYMELKNLPPNDPTKTQYQLWVVDKAAPFKEPVDGGVFDVRPDGTALVPIRSPLVLRDVTLFAVTVEPPGGVVVSENGKQGKFEVVMKPTG